jgi:hypothetical protein
MRKEGEALVIAMALVPGLFSRNRWFSLFEDPAVRRARRRATLLRGIVRHLATAAGAMESLRIGRAAGTWEVSYRLPAMKMQRQASLSDAELACVHHLVSRAGIGGLQVTDQDKPAIDAALRRLVVGLPLGDVEAALE